jgi:hypothetical protein
MAGAAVGALEKFASRQRLPTTLPIMTSAVRRSGMPFWVVAAVIAIVCIAILRLPDLFVAQMVRNRPLTDAQSGWAYRLLVMAALAQAAYGGFALLRPERIRRDRERDPKVGRMTRGEVLSTVTRNAAFMLFLTIVYGLAAFIVTGERGGFWVFPLMALAQGGWYYRQVGQIERWLNFQPEVSRPERPPGAVPEIPPDYCPPLARGLGSPHHPR